MTRQPLNLLVLLVAFTYLGCSHQTDRSTVVLRLGHMANDQNIWHKSAVYFGHVLDSLTNGEVTVKVFPSEQLGPELDLIRTIGHGIVDMTITGESMQNWSAITSFCGTPYLINDLAHLDRVLSGRVGEQMANEMITRIGLKPLAYFARGPRHLTSNRPIRSPDDLNGLVMRVPPVPISVAVWEALGAKPTPMAFSEIFTAMQSGTVEAQENPFSLIQSAGFYEVQDYVNLTGHVIGWVYLTIGTKTFDKLTSDQQSAVLTAGQLAQVYHDRLFSKQELALKRYLEDKGMEMVAVDGQAFEQIASQTVKASLSNELIPYYEEVKRLAQ